MALLVEKSWDSSHAEQGLRVAYPLSAQVVASLDKLMKISFFTEKTLEPVSQERN